VVWWQALKGKTQRNNGKGFKRVRVFYSHPLWTYGTEEEAKSVEDIKMLLGTGVEVINPRDYDKEFRESGRRKEMSFCFRLIDTADCVVFSRFRPPREFKNYALMYLRDAPRRHAKIVRRLRQLLTKRSLVTPGVAKEVNYTLEKGKTAYELLDGRLKVWKTKISSDFQGRDDPCFISITRLLIAWKNPGYGIPPFWWLDELQVQEI
jgi:hypothetical protein